MGAYKKRREFFYKFHEQNIDIVFLQETHSTKSSQHKWKTEWGGPIHFSHGTGNARGVAILLSKNFDHELINTKTDGEGRALEVRIRHEELNLSLLNIYAPNEDKP